MKNIRSTSLKLLIPTVIALSLSACGGGGDSNSTSASAPTLKFTDPQSTYELDNYSQIGNVVALQVGTGANLLNAEASGVTYDKDDDSLYVIGDGGTSVAHVSKTGALIDSMELNAGDFGDTEGITYIGGGKFALIEERIRQINQFTYVPGGILHRTDVQAVVLGTPVGNNGIEGISYDPKTNGFIAVKQSLPESIFQTNVDFAAGTATNGSSTTVASTDMFDPNDTGLASLNDVFALSNIVPATAPDYDNVLFISATSGLIVKTDRNGKLLSSLPMDAKGQNEGMTMGPDGTVYIVGEQAAGPGLPGMTVFKPTTGKNNVGPGSNLYLTFNEPIQAGFGDIVVSNGAGGTKTIPVTDSAQVSFNGNTVKINPGTNLAGGANYSITYAAGVFRTASGSSIAALSSTTTLSFTTTGTADTVAPTLASTSPANAATNITAGDHLALNFNEAVQAGTGKIVITGSDGDNRQIDVHDAQIKFSANTANINLTTALHPGVSYTVQLAVGVITDLAGNPFVSTTFTFSTAVVGVAAPTLLITEVNSNSTGGDFFELYNYGGAAIDISGWKWGDDHLVFGSNSSTFPAGTIINPSERLVVVSGTEAAFRTAWNNLPTSVKVFADPAGQGLGGGDVVVVYDSSAKVVTWFNFEGTDLTGTTTVITGPDGTVLTPAAASVGITPVFPNHAGLVFGGANKSVSAVWDGLSPTTPTYQAAVSGTLNAFVQTGDANSIGSPGQ